MIRPPKAGDAALGNPVAFCKLSTVSIVSAVHLDSVIETKPQKTPSKRYRGSSDIYEVMYKYPHTFILWIIENKL
jgi:hypothetical protein